MPPIGLPAPYHAATLRNMDFIGSAHDMAAHIRALQAEVDRLTAENEALRKDAERLDCRSIRIEGRDEFGEPCATVYVDCDLRAAIDEARQEKRGNL